MDGKGSSKEEELKRKRRHVIESLSKCIDVEVVFNATANQVCRTVTGKKTHIAECRRLLCRQEPSYFIVGDGHIPNREIVTFVTVSKPPSPAFALGLWGLGKHARRFF